MMAKVLLTEFRAQDVFGVEVDRLCIGRPVERVIGGDADMGKRHIRCYRFRPGQVFGVVRHRWLPTGSQHRALAIVEALYEPAEGIALAGISPAVRIHALVDQHGPAGQGGSVDRLLSLIDEVRHSGIDLDEVPPEYWRVASYQIMFERRRPSLPPARSLASGDSK